MLLPFYVFLVLLHWFGWVSPLDNGLALTPPMGWLSWERYRCTADCKEFPYDCVSESLIKRTADLMVSEGYKAAGYEYVSIDDCWLEHERGANGELVPDRSRFPSGMRSLADYIHSKGLKFGLYEDIGSLTCAGYPGVLGHEKQDVDTLVSWQVDHIKLDGCSYNVSRMNEGYPAFGKLLNESGRPILYSCSWPYFQAAFSKINSDFYNIKRHCNIWRNWVDVQDSFSSVLAIMDWMGDNQDRFSRVAGPGGWNHPDMLIIGNFGLSLEQARVQMSVWAVLAAPMFFSADLAKMRPEFKEILLNEDIIAVNQDRLGEQGRRVRKNSFLLTELWTRRLAGEAYAVAAVSRRTDGAPLALTWTLSFLELPYKSYLAKDLYDMEAEPMLVGELSPLHFHINPSGVRFFKLTPTAPILAPIRSPEDTTTHKIVYRHFLLPCHQPSIQAKATLQKPPTSATSIANSSKFQTSSSRPRTRRNKTRHVGTGKSDKFQTSISRLRTRRNKTRRVIWDWKI